MIEISEVPQTLLGTLVATCLGALVGLERQVAEGESNGEKDFPGVRTFAFTAMLGALAVLVSRDLGPWMGVALFGALSAFLVLRYRYDVGQRGDPGYTTEMAALSTFTLGALAQGQHILIATVITIAMVALLRSKRVMHRVNHLLAPGDMEALIRFLVISGIVLPLVPDDPLPWFYGVLRPRDIWRTVVLISGLSFAGYVLMRFKPGRASYFATGLLGGFVSSTAAAVSYGRAGARSGDARYEAMVTLATSTTFLRMLVVLAVVAPDLAPSAALPLLSMFVVMFALSWLRHQPSQSAEGDASPFENPLRLRLALSFAVIYAFVLVAVEAGRDYLGNSAVYATSALAALAGADAPSLSIARLFTDGRLPPEAGVLALVAIATATTLSKCAILAVVARGSFATRVIPSLLLVAATGGLWLYVLYD
jgi:uncharacterized membrane protein (DUF4010 family)